MPSNTYDWDKVLVAQLKKALDNGAEFATHDKEYIEAAYEQLGRGVALSKIQSWVINTIVEIKSGKNRKQKHSVLLSIAQYVQISLGCKVDGAG